MDVLSKMLMMLIHFQTLEAFQLCITKRCSLLSSNFNAHIGRLSQNGFVIGTQLVV